MNRILKFGFVYFCSTLSTFAQHKINLQDPEFDKYIHSLLNHSVQELDCNTLYDHSNQYIILDTREWKEYRVSHLPGAVWIGNDSFLWDRVKMLPRNKSMVCYCSVGFRSEKIVEKLAASGYVNVYNLVGSIFEWVNRGYPVVNLSGHPVKRIHTYNKSWSKWVNNRSYRKVY